MSDPCCNTSGVSKVLSSILAALGNITKIVSDNKTVVVEHPICDNGVQKIMKVTYKNGVQVGAVQYFDKSHNTVAAPVNTALVAFGECGGSAVTPGVVTVTQQAVTAAGTVVAGNQSVRIQNVGNAAGSVLGRTLYQNEVFEAKAYLDEATRVYYRLDAIAYDAGGTEFHITIVP